MVNSRLADKVAIIVGAGQQIGETLGNGRAVAIRFAQEGASCLLVDHNIKSAEETLATIENNGGTASVMEADITYEDSCRAVVETCVERYGRVDILHNNVGRSEGDRGTAELNVAMWDELFRLNLTGTFMMCKHVLPVMREQRSGVIINTSSTASLAARPTVAYKTSKGAVNSMTQHIAYENASYGIRANVLLPGLMDTPVAIERRARETGRTRESIREARDVQVPMGHMGTAEDVANAALFLASDEAKYITGILLPIDGGLLVKRA